ncbi:MAG: SPASM domain-containing protein [Candidatus Omnitrophica bacterium]|nr:SPASM domain-containing protein [Candidatus Omnitrophota bacterium]
MGGASKATYEKVRKGSDFDAVVHHIEKFCELKRKKARTKVRMVCVASRQELLMELPDLIRLASRLGVDQVRIKQRIIQWENVSDSGKYLSRSLRLDSNPNYRKVLGEAQRLSKNLRMPPRIVTAGIHSPSHPCLQPWNSMYISTEGKVIPCCTMGIPETWCLGDLTQEKLAEIWNNRAYRELRKQIRSNEIPEPCKACYLSADC